MLQTEVVVVDDVTIIALEHRHRPMDDPRLSSVVRQYAYTTAAPPVTAYTE